MDFKKLLLLIVPALIFPAKAEIYKCVVDGKTSYQDAPCAKSVSGKVFKSNEQSGYYKKPKPKCQVDGQWFPYDSINCLSPEERKKQSQQVRTRTTSPSTSGLLESKSKYEEYSELICRKEWTKRGDLDYRMYRHCLEQQEDGYAELVALDRYSTKRFYSGTSFPYCKKEWTKRGVTNVRMLVHCLKQEVDGMEDVLYYRKQYGKDKVDLIAAKAIQTYDSWRMAAYEVKKRYE